jgi:hypothetical protein
VADIRGICTRHRGDECLIQQRRYCQGAAVAGA